MVCRLRPAVAIRSERVEQVSLGHPPRAACARLTGGWRDPLLGRTDSIAGVPANTSISFRDLSICSGIGQDSPQHIWSRCRGPPLAYDRRQSTRSEENAGDQACSLECGAKERRPTSGQADLISSGHAVHAHSVRDRRARQAPGFPVSNRLFHARRGWESGIVHGGPESLGHDLRYDAQDGR